MKKRIRKKKMNHNIFDYILSRVDNGITVGDIIQLGYEGVRFERLFKKLYKAKKLTKQ